MTGKILGFHYWLKKEEQDEMGSLSVFEVGGRGVSITPPPRDEVEGGQSIK